MLAIRAILRSRAVLAVSATTTIGSIAWCSSADASSIDASQLNNVRQAIQFNDHSALRQLLDSGVCVDDTFLSHLYQAIEKGHDNVATLLLSRGLASETDYKDILHHALKFDRERVVRTLIDMGVSMEELFFASIEHGDFHFVCHTIDNQVDPSRLDQDRLRFSLVTAGQRGHTRFFRAISRELSPNNYYARYAPKLQFLPLDNALLAAVRYGHASTVRALLTLDLDVNANDGVLLETASKFGHVHVIAELFRKGAIINDKHCPVKAAIDHNQWHVLNSLFDRIIERSKYIPLLLQHAFRHQKQVIALLKEYRMLNAAFSQVESFSFMQTLLSEGADINLHNGRALRRAYSNNYTCDVRYLLQRDANPFVIDLSAETEHNDSYRLVREAQKTELR